LGLQSHPEGGFFRETYRSPHVLRTERGERSIATAILFLVTAGHPSRFHRLASDELWVHQAGAPLELALIAANGAGNGTLRTCVLGAGWATVAPHPDAASPYEPQALVLAGTWQAARLAAIDGADWALVTCVVTPGFEYEDFELARRDSLMGDYPHLRTAILELT
jgi:predicted cupin superfamily sugar epimerase